MYVIITTFIFLAMETIEWLAQGDEVNKKQIPRILQIPKNSDSRVRAPKDIFITSS